MQAAWLKIVMERLEAVSPFKHVTNAHSLCVAQGDADGDV